MREGMFVVVNGDRTMQVGRITRGAVYGSRGISHPATIYHLVPPGGGPLECITIPNAEVPSWIDRWQYPEIELTPACEECNRPAGFGACAATGVHAGPPQPTLHVVTDNPWARNSDGPCRCNAADCGECGRAGARRWTA